jgi:hypothetical protein
MRSTANFSLGQGGEGAVVAVIQVGPCEGTTLGVSARCTCTWKPLLSSLPMSLSFSAALILSTDSLRMFLTATLPSYQRTGQSRGETKRGDDEERTEEIRRVREDKKLSASVRPTELQACSRLK